MASSPEVFGMLRHREARGIPVYLIRRAIPQESVMGRPDGKSLGLWLGVGS
ncbi:MAG: hypothetical protein AB1497_12260 [Bacillota bacterium]